MQQHEDTPHEISHVTHLHIATSFCLEIWRFLSEAINTRLAYVANYTISLSQLRLPGLLLTQPFEIFEILLLHFLRSLAAQ